MAKENNPQKIIGVIIALGIIAFFVLILYVMFNNIPSTAISSTRTTSFSDTILADNASVQTLSETPIGSVTTTALNRTWLSFDGINDEVNLGGNNLCIGGTINFTISAWVNVSSGLVADDYTILSKKEGSECTNCLWFYLDHLKGNLTFSVDFETDTDISAKTFVNDSNWHHVAVTVFQNTTNANVTMFVDGVIENSTLNSEPISITTTKDLIIGSRSDRDFFNGSIDEFRIYGTNLSVSDISQINSSGRTQNKSLPKTNLFCWFPFNENSGTTVHSFNETELT